MIVQLLFATAIMKNGRYGQLRLAPEGDTIMVDFGDRLAFYRRE